MIYVIVNVILTAINLYLIFRRGPKGEYTENGVQFRNKKGKVVISSDQVI